MKSLLTVTLAVLLLASCKKENEAAPATLNMKDYYPLQLGKYITYKLDSTVFINLNTVRVVRSYVVKDIVDYKFQDAMGNDVYRIRRMMRDNNDTTLWFDNATFLVTQTARTTEFTENNLRFIKLVNPVKLFGNWDGNAYIDLNDDFLDFYAEWDYFYETVDEPFTIGGKTFDNTITVNQVNTIDGDTTNFRVLHEVKRSKEVYAKGIGLVYRDFYHAFWQPIIQAYQPNSYGIRMTILNHN